MIPNVKYSELRSEEPELKTLNPYFDKSDRTGMMVFAFVYLPTSK